MNTVETYRPANIQFNVDGNKMPENLGFQFNTAAEAAQFFGKYISGISSKVRASRFMDNYEKKMIREDYQQLLEQKIPMLERELMKAKTALDEAKKTFNDASEAVSATFNEAKSLALEVKRGIVEMELDDLFTWKVPVGDKYYFYTFIDNQIKLCKVVDIPFHEKTEIFNVMQNNEAFFADYYPEGSIDAEKFEGKEVPSGSVDVRTGEIHNADPGEDLSDNDE